MNKRESVTLKDMARQLGLSKSTVSRALRDSTEISIETKQRVLALANQLEYNPNPLALGLLSSHSHTIGVLVPEIANPFFSMAISGIEEVAYTQGYHVTIYQSHEDYPREVMNTKHIFNRRTDGLIVSISLQTTDLHHFRTLMDKGCPVVFFDRIPDELEADKVVVDDFDGAYRATEHLIRQGCRRIAHLAGPAVLAISKQRMYGYRAALSDHEREVPSGYIIHGDFTTETAIDQAALLLDLPVRPDGIFAANDRMALGLHFAIRRRGLRIPEDIALIGFTDLPVAPLLDPPLSSMTQPAFEMGQAAARLLISRIEAPAGTGREAVLKVLKTTLTARSSSLRNEEGRPAESV